MRQTPILPTALLLAPLASLHAADAPKPATKPNVVFILADDQRFDTISALGIRSRASAARYARVSGIRLATRGRRGGSG